jgi:lipoprotein NlpI
MAYGELGTAYGYKRDFDRSITNLITAIKLAPKDPTYLRQRGYVQFCRGDFEAAAADLRNALDLADDTYTVLFHYLARARTTGGALHELETHANRARDGKWPAPMIELYLGTRDVNSALAAANNVDERGEAQFFLGQWHLLRNDRTQAIKAFQAAACSCPTWFVEHAAAIAELGRLQ